MKSSLGRFSKVRKGSVSRMSLQELKKQYSELKDTDESGIWRWYWQVRLTPNLNKHKKNKIWQYYDWLFTNQTFENYKAK